MVVQVQKVGNTFSFELPLDAVNELELVDGASIEIRRPDADSAPAFRYASVDETMRIHRKMEPRHAEAYRELAK